MNEIIVILNSKQQIRAISIFIFIFVYIYIYNIHNRKRIITKNMFLKCSQVNKRKRQKHLVEKWAKK